MKISISDLKALCLASGFDAVGFTSPSLPGTVRAGLGEFLGAGHHGDMDWMAKNQEVRSDPSAIWPDAKSVIVLGMNYGPKTDPMLKLEQLEHGNISVYALNRDYHDVIKGRLKQLCQQLQKRFGGDFRVYVDTAPVMEKPLAAQTAMGWQGKHTCVVSREFGSWLLLGEIFTDLEIAPDEPENNHCGTCSRCMEVCPTQALPSPGVLDARRCISYLTIEHKGHIPAEFRAPMGNRIYGCDDCLAVCPWNKFAETSSHAAFHARSELESPLLAKLAMLDDAGFRTMFSASPIKRIGRDRFVRNVLIALGNTGNNQHISLIEGLLTDASPLVRAMAVWALSKLMDKAELSSLQHYAAEEDVDVKEEWVRALDSQRK